ncbi:MAG: mechanosensitive ion channel domain-containing protein [Pirellulales bacterium]
MTPTLLAEAPLALSLFDVATWDAAWQRVVVQVPSVVTGIVLVLIFWIGARIARAVILRMGSNRRINADAVHILADGLKWTVLTIGLITGLGTVGVDVSALIAGLGLTGLALGIALKDVVSNSIAGIMILIYKPFQRHDRITITGLEGTVVQIDLRFTTLETPEQRILIPNANLLTNSIVVRRKPPPSPIQSETD